LAKPKQEKILVKMIYSRAIFNLPLCLVRDVLERKVHRLEEIILGLLLDENLCAH